MHCTNMKFNKIALIGIIMLVAICPTLAVNKIDKEKKAISSKVLKSGFALADGKRAASIYIDNKEETTAYVATDAFAKDIALLTGFRPSLKKQNTISEEIAIIVGTIGQSSLIKQVLKTDNSFASLNGKWETFTIKVVENPIKGVKRALVVAGSDKRGLAYGLFELSRQAGVSPFVYWADVVPTKTKTIYFDAKKVINQSPSVKYRGIFLNDEDWGLQPWAAKNIDTDVKDIGPKTYEKIFELLLRLKANYIWPAMHPSTKAFWYYPQNAVVANNYGIFVGASHCEPMLRNNVFEWAVNFENEYGKKPGEWRYDVNEQQIHQYWEDRAAQAAKNDAVYTVGMRGIHDGDMPGPSSMEGKKQLLEKVITDQRLLLNKYNPNKAVAQIFCPYKEVLDIYQDGLKLPEDITIVWADDNHGYIRQLSNPTERKRIGGSGVYYHLSYWGRPKDYLWLSSIAPPLIAYEMSKAYQLGADKLWVFNVGDIKPAEAEMQFSLDLAWNVNAWPAEKAANYSLVWAEETFGAKLASQIAAIKNEYYKLAAAAKPEHVLNVKFSEKEMQTRLVAYQKLTERVEKVKPQVPTSLKSAYYQLIEYPVKGAMLMNEKIFNAKLSFIYAQRGEQTALTYAKQSLNAFEEIKQITEVYNKQISGGKWDGMMDWNPRKQEVFKMPKVAQAKDIAQTKTSNVEDLAIEIEARDFTLHNKTNLQIKGVQGLGVTDLALSILPFKEDLPTDFNELPFAEYKIANLNASNYQIDVKALPTFPIYSDKKLGYAIAINNETPQWVNLETLADTPTWDTNVLRGFAQGTTQSGSFKNKSINSIKIYFTSPGFVLSGITLKPVK